MKQNILIIILSVLLVALIAVAAVTYSALSEDYVPSDVLPAETSGNSAAVTEEVETAPDFTMTDADGSEVSLSDFLGKPIVINFWATWCSPCKSELPTFDAAYATYGEDVQFIMLNLTDAFTLFIRFNTAFLRACGGDPASQLPAWHEVAPV